MTKKITVDQSVFETESTNKKQLVKRTIANPRNLQMQSRARLFAISELAIEYVRAGNAKIGESFVFDHPTMRNYLEEKGLIGVKQINIGDSLDSVCQLMMEGTFGTVDMDRISKNCWRLVVHNLPVEGGTR